MEGRFRVPRKDENGFKRIGSFLQPLLSFSNFVAIGALIIAGLAWRENIYNNETAKASFNLQKSQFEDAKRKDSLQRIDDIKRDSEQNIVTAKVLEQSDQQILALKAQAEALDQGVRNTKISQQPYIDIDSLRFHDIGDGKALLSYKIVNLGIRPAILRRVTVYWFDESRDPNRYNLTKLSGLLFRDKSVKMDLDNPFSSVMHLSKIFNTKDLYKLRPLAIGFVITYKDPLYENSINKKTEPSFFEIDERINEDQFVPCNEVSERILLYNLKQSSAWKNTNF